RAVADDRGDAAVAESYPHIHYVESDLDLRIRFDCLGDLLDVLARRAEARDAERRAVAEEDLGEAFGHDAAESVAVQRLRRVLARAAAAEVHAAEQDARALVARVVERV